MQLQPGDPLVHLQHGLAHVIAMKTSPLEAAVIRIDATRTELWIPLSAWREHVIAIPSRDAAEAWRASVLEDGPRPPGGDAAARQRMRALESRGFKRQLTALRDAYRCGDQALYARQALELLEERLLPVLALALETAVDALSAELRAAIPGEMEVAELRPVPTITGLEVVGRGDLTAETCLGTEPLRVRTKPGAWLAYVWDDGEDDPQLVAIHEDHVGRWSTLRRELVSLGTVEGGQALIYQASMLDDPCDEELLYMRAGELDGMGFAIGTGGDGPYGGRGAYADGDLVCIIVGRDLDAFRERRLQGLTSVDAALETCEEWRRAQLAGEPPPPERELEDALVAALELLVERRHDARVRDELVRVEAVLETGDPEDPWYAEVRGMIQAGTPASRGSR